ncbi:MAG: hypothetical protein ABIJ05_00980 [Patescibacteria group bacterium]
MSDTKLIQTVLDKVTKIDGKVDRGFKDIKKEVINNRKRIGRLGLDLAELQDNTPTIEEFDNLKKRVGKLEKTVASV